MVRGKHAKVNGRAARRGAHVKVPERRMVTAVGYPLAFAAVCALAIGPGYAIATEAGKDAAADAAAEAAKTSSQTSNAPVASSKDETVYVFTKADGSVKNVEVSDKLTNTDKSSELADSSTLTNIENVEGDESYRGTGDSIVWDAQGSDIYYRGETDAELPLSMSVTYKLDGRTVNASDLAGKSGKVEIAYSFKNNTEAEGDVQVPLAAITGMLFSNDNFSDIEVDNGKVIDDGDRVVVVGYAMPGLASSLDVSADTIDIPSGFTVTAQATDFELNSTLTMVTGSLFDSVNMDDLDTSELSDASGSLKDAMSQLMDGAGQLADGAGQLADGTATMQDKVSALPDGVQQLYDGSGDLAEGLGAAASGASDLADGAASLNAGLNQILGDGSSSNPGITAAQAGAHQLHDQLEASQKTLVPKITALVTGLESAQTALTSTTEQQSVTFLNGAASQYIDAAIAASTETPVKEALAQAKTFIEGSTAVAAGAASGLADAESELTSVDIGTQLGAAVEGAGQLASGLDNAVTGMQRAVSGSSSLSAGASELSGKLPDAAAGATELNDGLGTLNSSTGSLIEGVKQLVDGTAQLASGTTSLKDGLAQFNDEGIAKITDFLDSDLVQASDKFEAVRDAGEKYDNFSGITEGTKGSVKFVIETDAIEG